MNPHDAVSLNVVHSVYKTKTIYQKLGGGELFPERKEVLVKQIKVKKWFVKESISSIEEYVNSKNQISRKRSVVFDKYSGRFYATFHTPEEVLDAISANPVKNSIGFTHDTKIHPTRPQVHKHKKRR